MTKRKSPRVFTEVFKLEALRDYYSSGMVGKATPSFTLSVQTSNTWKYPTSAVLTPPPLCHLLGINSPQRRQSRGDQEHIETLSDSSNTAGGLAIDFTGNSFFLASTGM